jgi:hypothetical protein
MLRLLAVIFIVSTGIGLLGAQAHAAEIRVALVIGNGAYQNAPPLPNPRNDATDVAAAFKQLGFETILATDLDKNGMDDAAIPFARAARVADVAMFYYSGHAMQFGGVNYLAPIDAKLKDEDDLRRMFRVDDVVADLQQAKNLRILVLDSCRDNPLADELRRSIGATRSLPLLRGLAKTDALGMIVAYATQAGRTAEDGDGRNSPYTAAFLKNIDAPEEIGTIFRRVSADVYETTKHNQLPELSLSLIGEFYLEGNIEMAIKQHPSPAPQLGPPLHPAAKAWTATQNTTSVAVLEEFIRQFGDTIYGGMARARLEELKKSQVTVASPPNAQLPALPQSTSPSALPDSLMRSSCWVSSSDNGQKRTLCFFPSGRATSTNVAKHVADGRWNTCHSSGTYKRRGDNVTVSFRDSSGKCNDGATSTQWSAECDFSSDVLTCDSVATVYGKQYPRNGRVFR